MYVVLLQIQIHKCNIQYKDLQEIHKYKYNLHDKEFHCALVQSVYLSAAQLILFLKEDLTANGQGDAF